VNIKTFVHHLHRTLQSTNDVSLPRSHLYEGLAAAFGYTTYAALTADAVFDEARMPPDIDVDAVERRLRSLGLEPASARVAATQLIAGADSIGLSLLRLSNLVLWLMGEEPPNGIQEAQDVPPEFDDLTGIDDLREMLRDGLTNSADRGNALAAYAMARLLRNSMDDEDASMAGYWYQQMKADQPLSNRELEFATEYAAFLEARTSYERYLTTAARAKLADACIDAADTFNDSAWLEGCDPAKLLAPMAALEVFEHHGRRDLAYQTCRRAALGGDPHAIELLLSQYDLDSPVQASGWIYFAEMRDIQLDGLDPRTYAIHEDGSPYDDDVGGPIFAVETEGYRPRALNAVEDIEARDVAQRLEAEASKLCP